MTAGEAWRSHQTWFDVAAFEWLKARTVRSIPSTAVLVGLVMPGIAAFVVLTGSHMPDDTVLGASLTGAPISLLLAGTVGVLVVSGEYGTGTIRSTLTAAPRRGQLLAAKVAVVAAGLFGLAIVGSVAAVAIGWAGLASGDHASGEPFPAVLGVSACLAVVGALGVAVGVLVRHAAGALATVLALVLLPSVVAPLLGDLQRWVGGASPMAVLQKLTQTSDVSPESVGALGGWPSLVVLAALTSGILLFAGRVLDHRDA